MDKHRVRSTGNDGCWGGVSRADLSETGSCCRSWSDRFVQVYVAIADLDVESARRVRTDPSFPVNRGALAAEVRKGDQIAYGAGLALGEFHQLTHLHTLIFSEVCNGWGVYTRPLEVTSNPGER